jgi:uncharacterized protein YdeI (YjbR/CyaY-like superfamily)
MEMYKGKDTLDPANRKGWRKWLEKNHKDKESVFLIIHHKDSAKKGVSYPEAVEEALCFGWIDAVKNKRDDKSVYQYFAKRKPKSKWSALNKKRVAALTSRGLMTENGQKMIDLAKRTGTWKALEEIDAISIPGDLQIAFNKNKKALKYFEAFSPSSKKIILHWIMEAKRSETRQKRIKETVVLAAKNLRARHPRSV